MALMHETELCAARLIRIALLTLADINADLLPINLSMMSCPPRADVGLDAMAAKCDVLQLFEVQNDGTIRVVTIANNDDG
jgi:hypothetical protein